MSFDADAQAALLEHLKGGMQIGAAAYVLKLPRHVVDGYIAEHPEYAVQVREAEATATEHVLEAVYQAAVSGNVQAARLWLDHRDQSPRRGPSPAPAAPPRTPSSADPDLDAAMGELEP